MSGFFDGILLHQILQWHHLLSAWSSRPGMDLRFQVAADGYFHALMYVIAALGLWLVVARRQATAEPGAGRIAMVAFLTGFGIWHVADAVLSHWVLGIHRIRMDAADPLLWDLGWLGLFGLVPLVVAWRVHARGGRRRAGGAVAIIATGVIAAAVANLAPIGGVTSDTVTVVLRPGVSPAAMLSALDDTDASIVWGDAAGGVWVMSGLATMEALGLYRQGAIYVSGAAVPAGCAQWIAGTF